MEKEDRMERYMRDQRCKAESLYNVGFKEGKNIGYALGKENGYAKGLKDAWDVIRFIADETDGEVYDVFGLTEVEWDTWDDLIREYEAEEICEPILKYLAEHSEQAGKIEIGDIVCDENGLWGVVTNTDTHYHILYSNGKTWKAPKSYPFKKTGRKGKAIIENQF